MTRKRALREVKGEHAMRRTGRNRAAGGAGTQAMDECAVVGVRPTSATASHARLTLASGNSSYA